MQRLAKKILDYLLKLWRGHGAPGEPVEAIEVQERGVVIVQSVTIEMTKPDVDLD